MKVSNVNNKDKKARSGSVFIGRDTHSAEFMKKYNEVYDVVQSEEEFNDITVFAYNGSGGIGKSTLIDRFSELIEAENKEKDRRTFFVKVDFDKKLDTCDILSDIAKQLSKKYHFKLSSFKSAFTEYRIARGDNVEDCIDAIMGSPVLELINIFTGKALSNKISIVKNLHKLLKDTRKKSVIEELGDDVNALRSALPSVLGADISEELTKRGGVLVVALDTYERLVNSFEDKNAYLNDMWLRDTDGLISFCKNTIWLICGREPLGWDRKRWDADTLVQNELKPFDETDGCLYLASLGVDDAQTRQRIFEVTGGAPFFMKLCAEAYAQCRDGGRGLSDDFFDISYDRLYERFVRYFNEDQTSAVSVMACLGTWNDELLQAVGSRSIADASSDAYELVSRSTIVRRNEENGISVMQKDCQKALMDRCDEKLKTAVYKAAVELCGEKLTEDGGLSEAERELYSTLYNKCGVELYGEDFGLTRSQLVERAFTREINKISGMLEENISSEERAEMLLYLISLCNQMYLYVNADECYVERIASARDKLISMLADKEDDKSAILKVNLADNIVEIMPQAALKLYDEVCGRLKDIFRGQDEIIASVMIQRLELINGMSINKERRSLERSADEVIGAYRDIIDVYADRYNMTTACKWYSRLCRYIDRPGKPLSAEYYSIACDVGEKLFEKAESWNIDRDEIAAAILDMYDRYASTDRNSLELALLAYEKGKKYREHINGFVLGADNCRRISAVAKLYRDREDHENALKYYGEELNEKTGIVWNDYTHLLVSFKAGDHQSALARLTYEQEQALVTALSVLPYSARNIAEAAEKCGRYDLAVSPLRNGLALSRSVYDLCRFWCEKGVLYGSPMQSLTMFGNALVDAYRSTGDTENMLKTMQELYNFVRDDVNSSDKDIASAANDIAWEYFTCGKSELAEKYIAEALERSDKTIFDYRNYVDSAAYIYADIGKSDIAMKYAEELMSIYVEQQTNFPENSTNGFRIAEAEVTAAYCHAKAGRREEAEAKLENALAVLEELSGQPVKGMEYCGAVYDDGALQRARKLKQELSEMPSQSPLQSEASEETQPEQSSPDDRKYTEYDYDSLGDSETDRLAIQQRITARMDIPVLKRIFAKYKSPVVIDLGCNQGDLAMARFSSLEYGLYLGIDHSAAAIEAAEKQYGSSKNKYHCADGCNADFVEDVRAQLKKNGADGADIIFVSMMMLHCKEPEATLRKLRGLLREGGTIFIRDIDDRDNFAFPDPDEIFEKAFEHAKCNPLGGDRHCGRKLGGLLRRAGFKNVTVEERGLSTVGMNEAERMALYHTYFDFQIPDTSTCLDAAPNDAALLQRLGWWVYNLPRIEKMVRSNDVELTIGFIVYTAEK